MIDVFVHFGYCFPEIKPDLSMKNEQTNKQKKSSKAKNYTSSLRTKQSAQTNMLR